MVKRLADNAFIPFDEGNRDYQEYKQWLSEGNEPDTAEPPPGASVDLPASDVSHYSPEEELAQQQTNKE